MCVTHTYGGVTNYLTAVLLCRVACLSMILPVVAAGAAGPECLSQLICDHPLHTARALEGGLRVDWTLRWVGFSYMV